jgi:putative phosphoribosyl transferase
MVFRDRVDAGRQLALRLTDLRLTRPVVVGLPRGGVPVAAQVARRLRAPLDVIVVRKLGAPRNPEVAMGALGEGGVLVLNDDVVARAGVSERALRAVQAREQRELDRRVLRFRGGRPGASLSNRTVVVVDDGVATGATARAACQVASAAGAAQVVLAVPVVAPDVLPALRAVADQVVFVEAPAQLYAVGQWYDDFRQVDDAEVVELLEQASRELRPDLRIDLTLRELDVSVETSDAALPGHLTVPGGAQETVVFAHGSGSSRHSPRNAYVARVLNEAGLGTLLLDLLAPAEEDEEHVFDIPFLAGRLAEATRWLRRAGLGPSRVGYFGASTGAAAALWAAAEPYADIAAVGSRGGRPDLALPRLAGVRAPTLLVVGGEDRVVLDLNRAALKHLTGPAELAVVPGATHLFEEPGTLAQAAALAREWFLEHLAPVAQGRPLGGETR